ncbi:hypothetical protein [Dapis sp. BLCC M172]|uniref:ABC transporter substrate-binding protein n=1 Tax=Dapis sp. BLCC M172 TaxID=2975281 RepID=UPI003CEB5C8E
MGQKYAKLFVSLFISGLVIVLFLSCASNLTFRKLERTDPSDKTVVVVAEDLRNGGIIGVVVGIQEACQALNWDVKIFDISSSATLRHQYLVEALALKPDGLILVGGDIVSMSTYSYLKKFEQQQIPIVGWHVAPYPGSVPNTPVQVNVTTDSRKVALAAAGLVQPEEGQTAGVVVFTDRRINIALEKANQMVKALESCDRCTVLSVEDIPLDQTASLVPPAIRRLQKRYGNRWTHSLAINDLYFDHAINELVSSDLPTPLNISAGDGSISALLRMKHKSYQYASVAEPLLMHGWQLVDEIHRNLMGVPPSGYVNQPYVVTQKNAASVVNSRGFFEPDRPYRQLYQERWRENQDG